VIAFSPILRFEELIDKLEVERPAWLHPALAGLQTTVRDRMIEKHYPNPCGSVRELLKYTGIGYDEGVADGLEYVRLMPYKDLPAHDRLNGVRIPVLIVHAADDMLAPAQDLANLMATVRNPDVAAILLPSGGHIGFGPYASAWYYNLVLNFFDPAVGAAAGR
jgi:pimeloyl-ACP methyl ester carboxylesterase